MLEELLVWAKLAELYRVRGGGHWPLPLGPRPAHQAGLRYQPVVEHPRPAARRILGRWLAVRRAAACALDGAPTVTGVGQAPLRHPSHHARPR